MLRYRILPQSEVIRAIVLEYSPCCEKNCCESTTRVESNVEVAQVKRAEARATRVGVVSAPWGQINTPTIISGITKTQGNCGSFLRSRRRCTWCR